jgi:serine/threonine-protein kinase
MSSHSHSADRNLLFGIIALQMDFISRDQLIAAMAAWVQDKQKSLGEVLCEQGALSPEDDGAIESLVRRHLLRHHNDAQRSLAALSAIGQRLRDELSRITDPDVQATLPLVGASRSDTDSNFSYAASSTASAGRYRILRPHAEGGLGVVSVALDEELHREVALKEIQERYASHEQSRLRFLLEAEITGGLEHPGIVPVYGLGHHRDGRPFYAMRFVRGESLKATVARFHSRDEPLQAARSPVGQTARQSSNSQGSQQNNGAAPTSFARSIDSLELRRLLSRFLDVCNAIAYAHSRGVLHRDIKPANILLGPYGETLVVDWGLAKIVGRDERETSEPTAEPTLRPPSASEGGETVPGTALGTPAYMSPEQAEGRLDLLGPASDVYSLGATLYVILTGRAPFAGSDAALVLPRVQRGEFVRPRAVNATIPAALEAICVKAMALKPADRYQTPRALVEDIEHWLADEPVSAYRDAFPDRARRWSRKHRTLVTSAAAVLVLGLLTSACFAAAMTAKNRDLAKQTRRAETREKMAIDAVKRFRDVVVAEPALKNDPSLGELRKKLLKEPLAFFKSFREQLQADQESRPDALARLAEAAHEYAHLTEEIGDIQDGLTSHVESLAIWEKLMREHPENADYQWQAATIQYCRGTMLRTTGRLNESLELYARAQTILEQLVREHPSVIQYSNDLAVGYLNIGILKSATGHPDEALESYSKALAIHERLARENPHVIRLQRNLAKSHFHFGGIEGATGHRVEAMESYRQALTIQERLVRENSSDTQFQSDIALTLNTIGSLHREMGQPDKALGSHQNALAIQRRLAGENPSVTHFQSDLARTYHDIGIIQSTAGWSDQARESYANALAIRIQVARANPSVAQFQRDLATSYNDIGVMERATGHPDQAIESYAKSLAIRERLLRENPDSTNYASTVGATLNNMAAIDLDAKRFQQARDKLRQARDYQKKALDGNPRHPIYRQFLLNHLNNLITAAKALGDNDEARAVQREVDELSASVP